MDRDNPSILDSKIPKLSINQPSSRFYPLKNLMFCWFKSLSNDELIINQSSSINHIHLYLHILLAKVPIKWRTFIFWWLEPLWIHHDFPAIEKVELTRRGSRPATVQFQDLRHRQLTTWPRKADNGDLDDL